MISMKLSCPKYLRCVHFNRLNDISCIHCKEESLFVNKKDFWIREEERVRGATRKEAEGK